MSKVINIGGRLHSTEQGNVLTGANEILDDTKGKKQNVINSETDAELLRLEQSKQDNLTFDNAPTENSNNPVKSGGVYAADKALSDAIEAILLLIPSAATVLNKLADIAFVNSSVSTNTSTFRGTYNVVTDLELAYDATHEQIASKLGTIISTADNNDYSFVQIPVSATSTDIRRTERYKYNGTAWGFEYDLNTSGFTAAQWAAINSTITLALVQKLAALPTNAELLQALGLKQDVLTFDNAPTMDSNNPVKSGGIKTAINTAVGNEATARENADTELSGLIGDEKTRAEGIERGLDTRLGAVESSVSTIQDVIPSEATSSNKLVDNASMTTFIGTIIGNIDATFNVQSTDGHVTLHFTQVDGVITSVQVTTSDIASAADLTLLADRVTSAEGNITSLTTRMSGAETDIATLRAMYNALQQSAPQVIEPTDTWPVANPSGTVIYRVIDRVNTPPEYYSDYMWNGTSFVLMATYNNAVDTTPKKDSANLVTSGGVLTAIDNAKDDIRNGEDVTRYQKIESYYKSPTPQTYFNFGNTTPTTWPYNSSPSTNPQITQYTTAVINVSAGTKFYIKGAASTDRQRMYLIADANNNVLADARMSPSYTRGEQSPIYQFNVDCRVFMNILSPWNNETDGVYGEVVTHIDGINEIVEELQENISTLSGRIEDIEDDVTTLNTDINGQEYDEFQQFESVIDATGYWGYPFRDVSVGGEYLYNASASHSSSYTNKSALAQIIPSGMVFKLKGYNDERTYVIVAKPPVGETEGEVLAVGTLSSRDEMTNEFTFNTECKVFMTIENYQSTDGVYKKVRIIEKGLKEEVEELQEDVVTLDNNPFKGKKIVTIGDSLCTSGTWQQRLCSILGANAFDNASNIHPSHPLTVGGTSMYGTKKDMGLCRVRNLEHLDFTPDVILLENVNDKSAFYTDGSPLSNRAGQITDKPYIIQQIIEDVATAQEWESDAESVLASIPSADRKFGTMLMITTTGAGKNVKPTTSPSTAGDITLTLTGGGLSQSYSIHVEANESLSSIVSKILEYNYAGYSDTLANDGESVDFFQESGLTNLQITYNANGTGLVLAISDTSTAKSQNGKFFDGESLSDWGDPTKWLDSILLYRAWKGVIEYCNIHYPNAKVYIVGFSGISGKSSDYILPDGTYDQQSFLDTQKRQKALVSALKNVAEIYSIPFIDLARNEGINITNINTFLPANNVHPNDVGYNRWGEVIASLMK